MSAGPDNASEGARIDALFRAKALAEVERADRTGDAVPSVRTHGDVLAEILLVKGEPGPDDRERGYALAGGDGEAAGKALEALGLTATWFAFCTRSEGLEPTARYTRIRLLVEAVDPSTVIALDPVAAADLVEATGMAPLDTGVLHAWRGRTVLAVDGLEASLSDPELKQRVWRQLKALSAPDSSHT